MLNAKGYVLSWMSLMTKDAPSVQTCMRERNWCYKGLINYCNLNIQWHFRAKNKIHGYLMILKHGIRTKRPRFVCQKDNFLSCDGYFDTLMVYVYMDDFVRCRNIKNGCMDAIYNIYISIYNWSNNGVEKSESPLILMASWKPHKR